jgi:hypothetical protein
LNLPERDNIHKNSTEISTEYFTPPLLGIDIHAIGETIELASPVLALSSSRRT